METETLFTGSKWDILKCLESGKKSPIDLAKEANTSVANISQQLRLLELAGFVKSERISNREKGLPRILYSLTGNYSYLVVSSPGLVNKKFMKLEDHQKTLLKIWLLEDTDLSAYVEKFFFEIVHLFEKIEFLGLDITDPLHIKAAIISDNAEIKKMKDITIEGKKGSRHFVIQLVKTADSIKLSTGFLVLHDPKLLIQNQGYNEKRG